MGPLRGFEPRSAAYETAILPVELQRHASAPKRRFFFLGQIPRAPNFAEFHARGGGGRLPVMPRDLIPPRGRTLLHGEAGKPTSAVGVASPNAVPQRGGGRRQRAGRRRTAGWFRRRAGQPSGVRAAHGGQKRVRAGKKAAHAGLPGSQGCARAPGSREKPGQAGSPSGRAPGKKTGGAGAKRGVRAGKKAGTAGAGGEKAPFCREKGGQRGCAGAKTGGESLRGV